MIYVGIDPGTTGGVAVRIDKDPPIIFPLKTFQTFLKTKNVKSRKPKVRNELDVDALVCDLMRVSKSPTIMWGLTMVVCIEKLHHGGRFADTTGQLMKNYGRLLGVFELYGVRMIEPTPQSWQKWCEANMSINARARATLSEDKKSLGIEYCRDKYPKLDLTLGNPRKKTPHDGCSDAVVLCDYLIENEEV